MCEYRCPNCRAREQEAGKPCSHCGWMPLQSTELRFVDDQTVKCPHCYRQRPIVVEACPYCGSQDVLETLSHQSSNYHLSTLLLLTTLVAICFALTRITVVLGIPAFILVALATLRTALLIGERKRHRYPVVTKDVMRMFGSSVLGILLGVLTTVGALIATGFITGPLFTVVGMNSEGAVLVLLILVVVGIEWGALYMVRRDRRNRPLILVGMAIIFLPGVFLLLLLQLLTYHGEEFVFMSALVIAALGALALACRRQGARRAKAFLVGCSIATCSLGPVAWLFYSGRFGLEVMLMFGYSAFLLWPLLLSIIVLEEKIWSWDDAFPRIAPRYQQPPELSNIPIVIEDNEGIDFLDDAADGNEADDEADADQRAAVPKIASTKLQIPNKSKIQNPKD